MKTLKQAALMVGLAWLFAGVALAQEAQDDSNEILDPAAIRALDRMAEALRGLEQFSVVSDASLEVVLQTGQKITLDGEATYRFKRPSQLFVELASDRTTRQLYFDDGSLTVYAPRLGYYAAAHTKAHTVKDMVVAAASEHGIEFPLTDLFFWNTDAFPKDSLLSALYVGPATVAGERVDQFAFRQTGGDWQIWLSQDTSLPRRIAIADHTDPSVPGYDAVLTWETQATQAAESFRFNPPEGARRIEITVMPDAK